MSDNNGVGMIYKLIPKVMKDIGSISKDRKNEKQNYQFRGIEDFYQAAHPAMINHGVFCAPKVLSRDVYRFEKINDQGRATPWVHVALEVEHHFYAEDGSSIAVTTWGEGLDNSDKASNKAMSGAMKYALIELFCVPTKDVEDADRDSPEAGMRRPPVAKTTEAVTFTKPVSAAEDSPPGAASTTVKGAVTAPQAAGEDCIDMNHRKALHRQFKEALMEPLQKSADVLLQAWLAHEGYYEEIAGIRKGTTSRIPKVLFDEVKAAACKYAGECK